MIRGDARAASVRTPIFWLFLGPPIVRFGARDPLASLDGGLDPWNLFRIAWWLGFGALAVWELLRHRHLLPRLWHPSAALFGFAAAWVAAMFASLVVTPSLTYTGVYAGLMAILLVASLDLAVKVAAGRIHLDEILMRCLRFSLALLLLIFALFLVAPELVSTSDATWPPGRLQGKSVGGTHFLAVIVLIVIAYFVLLRRRHALPLLAWIPFALALLLLAETRTGYVQLVLGLGVLGLQWLPRATRNMRRAALAVACVVAATGVAAVAIADAHSSDSALDTAVAYLVRDENTLRSASGRDGIFAVVARDAVRTPWGLGYAAGPRSVLQSPDNASELWYRYGIVRGTIGDAHNMYLESYAGAGVLGAAALLGMLILSIVVAVRGREIAFIGLRALLVIVLVGGLTASAGSLPLNQSSALLMILVGAFAGAGIRAPER